MLSWLSWYSWIVLVGLLLVPSGSRAGENMPAVPIGGSGTVWMHQLSRHLGVAYPPTTGPHGEDAARYADYFGRGFLASGTIHGPSASCTSGPMTVVAYTNRGNRLATTGQTIDYATVGCNCSSGGSDTAWVMLNASGAATQGTFARVGTTPWYVDCTSTTLPTLPDDSVWIARVPIANGALGTPWLLAPQSPHTAHTTDARRYGMRCDGVSDDSEALRIAVQAGAPGVVLLPAGTCVLKSAITPLASHLTLQGHGMGRTVLQSQVPLGTCSVEGEAALLKHSGTASHITIRDLTITSTVTPAQFAGNCRGHSALYLDGVSSVTVERVEVTNFAGSGLWIEDGTDVQLRQNWFHDGYNSGASLAGVTRGLLFANHIVNQRVEDTDGNGIADNQFADGLYVGASSTTGSSSILFLGNVVDGCTRVGLVSNGTTTFPNRDIRFEANEVRNCGIGNPVETGAGIWVELTSGQVVIDGFVLANNKLGILVDTGVESAVIGNGTLVLKDTPLPAGQPGLLYGGIVTRADHTTIGQVTFLQHGTANNGRFLVYWLGPARQLQFRGNLIHATDIENVFWLDGLTAGEALVIHGNTFHIGLQSGRSFLQYSSTPVVKTVEIRDNVFSEIVADIANSGSTSNAFFAFSGSSSVQEARLHGNVIRSSNSTFLLWLSSIPRVEIVGNSIVLPAPTQGTLRRVIFHTGTAPVLIAQNHIEAASQYKVEVDNSTTRVELAHNRWTGGSANHVRVNQAAGAVLTGNVSQDATAEPYSFGTGVTGLVMQGNVAAETTLANTAPSGAHLVHNVAGGTFLPRGRLVSDPRVSVASAANITLSSASDYFLITGTTTITGIAASWPGRIVTLEFQGALTVVDDDSALDLAGNFATTANDTLVLISRGSGGWRELSRSAN